MIPYGKQTISAEDLDAVTRVLRSKWLTSGPKVAEFEQLFAEYVGAKYAVAVSSGTAALHLACLAAGLTQGDELITSPMTFAASSNCALYCGAKPIFVDIHDENGLIDEGRIEAKINSKTKIIIPVHYAGLPCNLEKIKKIADKHHLVIIEDACHALGAKYKNTKIGDCRYSDMAVFSFHPVKHITTGEGGMITTNSKQLYEKLLLLRSHGITKDSKKLLSKAKEPWFYEMQELGFNYRITDFQCALGISQLSNVDEFLAARRKIAKHYDQSFSGIDSMEVVAETEEGQHAYHLYVIKTKNKKQRLALFNFLKSNDIACQVHYIPVHYHPYYQKLGYERQECPVAGVFYERVLSLPIYPGLKKAEQQKVVSLIKDFYAA